MRRLFPLAAMLVVAAPLQAQKQVPGWSYTMNTTTDSGSGRTSSIAIRTSVTDTKLRMEFVQVSGMAAAAAAEGMYQILSMSDSTLRMVMPSQRMATLMAFPGVAMDMRDGPKFTSHASTSVEDLGPGGRVFGHDTHHVRVTSSGSYELTMGGKTCTIPVNGVSEMWIAPDIDITPAMRMSLKQYGVANANELKPSGDSKVPQGLPIRSIMRSTSTDRAGVPHTVTMTLEYRDIARTMFDSSYFEVPADFHTMDMRKMMAEIPKATMDSIVASQSEKTAPTGCVPTQP